MGQLWTYVQGVSEQLHKTYRKHGVSTYFKPYNTIRNFLVRPKDKNPYPKKCGVIYHIKCADCPQTYVGETARSLRNIRNPQAPSRRRANMYKIWDTIWQRIIQKY
jgi:hypothetical protein